MIRTVIIFIGFFNTKEGQIIFATPKINNAEYNALNPLLEELKQILADRGYSFELLLYCNEDFNVKVLQPLIAASESVADTSELFMRSLQLYNMFASQLPVGSTRLASRTSQLERIQVESSAGFSEMKIGMLVRSTLRQFFANGRITVDEIKKMQTYEYSKEVFNVNYPLLKEIEDAKSLNTQRLVNDRPRYWNEVFSIRGKQYLVCQEWFEYNNRAYFIKWLESIDKS